MTADSGTEPTQSAAQQLLGDIAPGLVQYTDTVLFGEVWKRPQLSPRDRSLITVTALVVGGHPQQLTFHFQYAKDNGVTQDELAELLLQTAFYAGWPKAMSAAGVLKQVFSTD